jgi:hypothetical protein
MAGAFQSAGWSLELLGWPRRPAEWTSDVVQLARHGRRSPRFPVLVGSRDV